MVLPSLTVLAALLLTPLPPVPLQPTQAQRLSLTVRTTLLAAHGFRLERVRAELPVLRELWVALATRER